MQAGETGGGKGLTLDWRCGGHDSGLRKQPLGPAARPVSSCGGSF